MPLATFYFISDIFEKASENIFYEYGGSYFPFVLVGMAVIVYMFSLLKGVGLQIREGQMYGTLESIFSTPTKPYIIAIAMGLWNFIVSSIKLTVFFLAAVIFFKLRLPESNFLAAAIIWGLSILGFTGIGILSAAFIIVFKRGDPISWAVTSFSGLFSGAYFPIRYLPEEIGWIGYLLPITYSVRGLRGALLQGRSLVELRHDILVLSLFCIILLPLAFLIFDLAIRKAKRDGSLSYY